ncbi:hypothetical protein [Tenggerimyces flavus]|uniref:Integrase n=1 Tax=Tenggerimyces flavus TaxID=1708749 RepID=A0ABV7YQ42_9ACTN|nr:hypothetical protein [Tenggerimyces flavus]MBM7787777.1 hypothetical protein [Tenggerimyces flavus]
MPRNSRPLTPEQRSLRARIGGHSVQAKYGPDVIAKRARANSPSSLEWHERQVDPDGVLTREDRRRRGEQSLKAYFTKLSLKSVRARRLREEAAQIEAEIRSSASPDDGEAA